MEGRDGEGFTVLAFGTEVYRALFWALLGPGENNLQLENSIRGLTGGLLMATYQVINILSQMRHTGTWLLVSIYIPNFENYFKVYVKLDKFSQVTR